MDKQVASELDDGCQSTSSPHLFHVPFGPVVNSGRTPSEVFVRLNLAHVSPRPAVTPQKSLTLCSGGAEFSKYRIIRKIHS